MKIEKLEQFIKDELIKVGFKKNKHNEYQYKDINIYDIDEQGISLTDADCGDYAFYDIWMTGCDKEQIRFYIKGLIEYQGKLDKLGYTWYHDGWK